MAPISLTYHAISFQHSILIMIRPQVNVAIISCYAERESRGERKGQFIILLAPDSDIWHFHIKILRVTLRDVGRSFTDQMEPHFHPPHADI